MVEEIMVSNVRPKAIFAGLVVTLVVAVFVPARFARGESTKASKAQSASASKPSLDYEFFKTRVEPIFIKKRWPDHSRCYVCHEVSRHGGGPLSLEALPAGASFWTEEQSRHNFEVVSKLVIPGDPTSSLFLQMPLAPEAGGLADTHQGGRQFRSKDDPDWKNMEAWVRGQKAGASPTQ
jgi:hypothetical protein